MRRFPWNLSLPGEQHKVQERHLVKRQRSLMADRCIQISAHVLAGHNQQ